MKLAIKAYLVTLILLLVVCAVPAQTPKISERDDRNTSPNVGTGGQVSGPTGLFTVLDGKTLRKGEYTFSAAYSNYDRDPGNVDISTVPLSFNVGLSNNFELFFSTEAWRGLKVNNPRTLSGFYLPNSQVLINGVLTSPGAIVLAPGTGGPYVNTAVFRPQGMPFSSFPYTGASAGNYGYALPFFAGPTFGFAAGTQPTLGPPRSSANGGADAFPGVGSVYGSILPGVVLATAPITCRPGVGNCGTQPTSFTTAPSYLPEAPFLNRTWGQSSFASYTGGFKWRVNNPLAATGYGVMLFYRWYGDTANTGSGFNQLQRGAGPGNGFKRGDFGGSVFVDSRLTTWANLSANVGFTSTSRVKSDIGGNEYVLLDRPDEMLVSIGADFPINKHFQPILEWSYLKYIGGQTPNAFQQDPMDGIAGFKVYPRRWWGFGFAYRYNFNQQDSNYFDGASNSNSVNQVCGPISGACNGQTVSFTSTGVPPGFDVSSNANGYIGQFWIGRRDTRQGDVVNKPANVDSVDLSATVITLPCRPGFKSRSGACADSSKMISVSTHASDPENDVLTYNYTTSGGRVVGTGANVQWDLSGAQVGSYTITTGVDDGCGICGKTDTKTIRVQECPDCEAIGPKCSCATVTVQGPSGVTNPGEAMTFTASVAGNVTYNWTVSAGTIESGQGTASITVRTTAAMAGSNVTATLEIGGTDPACQCPTSASEIAPVQSRPVSTTSDEFGQAPNDDVKARVDNFYIQLNNNPNAQGYIINYGTPAQIKVRKAQIDKAIAFRKYDRSRLVWVDGPDNGTGISTKFIIVPQGADKPQP